MGKFKIKKWYGNDMVRGISFTRDSDILDIHFAGNLDLYFSFTSKCNHTSFIIGKENYEVWEIFDKLYQDIVNAHVFDFTEEDRNRVISFADAVNEDYHEKLRYEEKNIKDMNENLKKYDSYKRLVNGKIIKWSSDDFYFDIAPYFVLTPLDNCYKISFGIPIPERKLDGDERFALEGHKHGTISIRLRNSGSNYAPFNNVFMKLFSSLMNLEEEYHQIHIEEYLALQQIPKGDSLVRTLNK